MTKIEADARAEPPGFLERRFELTARNTNIRTEILAGVTTFLTMAYIILL
ncbi:MAG TPA: NCS2 family permease, partial [Allosphingosinicella sp.]|nr:NCS2 family permease [Allosphingosinicella sp.]